jgi:hypothetical protein
MFLHRQCGPLTIQHFKPYSKFITFDEKKAEDLATKFVPNKEGFLELNDLLVLGFNTLHVISEVFGMCLPNRIPVGIVPSPVG